MAGESRAPHLYLFLNKRRRLAKALCFDGSGWCVLAKRLEAGSFQLPPVNEADSRVEVDGNTFEAIISRASTSRPLVATGFDARLHEGDRQQ